MGTPLDLHPIALNKFPSLADRSGIEILERFGDSTGRLGSL
jgi:hypothetical protein